MKQPMWEQESELGTLLTSPKVKSHQKRIPHYFLRKMTTRKYFTWQCELDVNYKLSLILISKKI